MYKKIKDRLKQQSPWQSKDRQGCIFCSCASEILTLFSISLTFPCKAPRRTGSAGHTSTSQEGGEYMDFADNKLTSFTKKIIDLIDQPNMQPNELKAYFDSSPEELRQAYNGLCDALTTATSAATAAANLGFQTTAGVPADNVQDAIENVQEQLDAAVMGNIPSGSVTENKLAQDVRDRFTTIETAAATEVTNRTNAVSAEATARAGADTNLQNQINLLQTTIATKSEIICGYYDGDGSASRIINLGKNPKAVLVITRYGDMGSAGNLTVFGGLAIENSSAFHQTYSLDVVKIVNNGFEVYVGGAYGRVASNASGYRYHYLAVI